MRHLVPWRLPRSKAWQLGETILVPTAPTSCSRLDVFMCCCMWACVHVCVYVCLIVCVFVCLCVWLFACMSVCLYVCPVMCVCDFACVVLYCVYCTCCVHCRYRLYCIVYISPRLFSLKGSPRGQPSVVFSSVSDRHDPRFVIRAPASPLWRR